MKGRSVNRALEPGAPVRHPKKADFGRQWHEGMKQCREDQTRHQHDRDMAANRAALPTPPWYARDGK